MIQTDRAHIARWIAPGFFIALFAAFVLTPWSFKAKLDAVCFGI